VIVTQTVLGNAFCIVINFFFKFCADYTKVPQKWFGNAFCIVIKKFVKFCADYTKEPKWTENELKSEFGKLLLDKAKWSK
jgi:hypothetical protein